MNALKIFLRYRPIISLCKDKDCLTNYLNIHQKIKIVLQLLLIFQLVATLSHNPIQNLLKMLIHLLLPTKIISKVLTQPKLKHLAWISMNLPFQGVQSKYRTKS